MLKRVLGSMALLATLTLLFAGLAAAQNTVTPTATIREQFSVQPSPGVLTPPFALLAQAAPLTRGTKSSPPPSYCSPCLFYGGDIDLNQANANGLYNGNTASSAAVYVPFTVTKTWHVTGLFANIEYYPSTPVFGVGPFAADVQWSIWQGLPTAPVAVCSGIDFTPGLTFTGRIAFGFYGEYTTAVSATCALHAGTYWLSVVPECNSSDGCPLPFGEELSYLSDAEDGGPTMGAPEAFGALQPWDDSYFNAPDFGYSYAATWGLTGACGGIGCDRFSVGVVGK